MSNQALTSWIVLGNFTSTLFSFNEGERISQCQITSGTTGLAVGHTDGVNFADVVAMDDFIYGEPQPVPAPPSNFDGDGVSDK
ncbi:MAG: hypothetical protein LC776_07550 [Acidobacteria bacterium]|nr:hypothetical protein [Acidobacteriota bacterium]